MKIFHVYIQTVLEDETGFKGTDFVVVASSKKEAANRVERSIRKEESIIKTEVKDLDPATIHLINCEYY